MQRLSSPNPYIMADHKCSQLRTVTVVLIQNR